MTKVYLLKKLSNKDTLYLFIRKQLAGIYNFVSIVSPISRILYKGISPFYSAFRLFCRYCYDLNRDFSVGSFYLAF